MSAQAHGSPNGTANGASYHNEKFPKNLLDEMQAIFGKHGLSYHNEKLPKDLVDEMQAIFGKHPGYRTSM